MLQKTNNDKIKVWDKVCTFSIVFGTLDSPNDIVVIIMYAKGKNIADAVCFVM